MTGDSSIAGRIALRGVHKAFGAKKVLNGVDLSVARGESLVIIGGSGSGKSVTLKCILGLLRPDAGQILVDGEDVTHHSSRKRAPFLARVGMLFQGAALFDSLPVWKNVGFSLLQNQGMSAARAYALAVETLERVGLDESVAALSPSELSGGMQKRVGLARAIATKPEIIFFDEPTTGLDPIMADVINQLIVECVEELGATTITITHDMSSVRKISTHVAMIYQGQIIWTGPIGSIDTSGSDYVDQFIHGRAEGPITNDNRRG